MNSEGLARRMLDEESRSESFTGDQPQDSLIEELEPEPPADSLELLKEFLSREPLDLGFETCLSLPKFTVYHKTMPPLYQHSAFLAKIHAKCASSKVHQYF